MIDEATLHNVLDSVTLLTALTYFLLWFDRHNLKKWQESVGSNVAAIVYTIAMIVRLILFILA